ncbi:hypothetical protein [Herbaspirillum huttiense]|uniref:hypothetical protein n=1 Tax=Herbaspirillum huttiense TaxID=863372 RepID=UPI0031D65CDE
MKFKKSEERITYQTLKVCALDSYFDFCRDSGLVSQWSHEQVIARVDYSFEEGFERPIEDLMWRVIVLILSGGWHVEFAERNRALIADLIAENGLQNMLSDLPLEEAEIFEHDLKILKLI